MKQLTCEMCGGTNLIKQDGVFVCQSCSCKYSVEEAKKMMFGDTHDAGVSPEQVNEHVVKIDNSSSVKKYLENARRAKEKTDWDEVEKYYNLVEQHDPKNIEAIFYSAYGKAMYSLSDKDRHRRQQKFDVFGKSISIIDDYYDPSKSVDLAPLIEQMSEDIISMTKSHFVANGNKANNDRMYTELMFSKVEEQFVESIENITQKDPKLHLYRILGIHYNRCIQDSNIKLDKRNIYRDRMLKTNQQMKDIDPTCQTLDVPQTPIMDEGCAGCLMWPCIIGFIMFIALLTR